MFIIEAFFKILTDGHDKKIIVINSKLLYIESAVLPKIFSSSEPKIIIGIYRIPMRFVNWHLGIPHTKIRTMNNIKDKILAIFDFLDSPYTLICPLFGKSNRLDLKLSEIFILYNNLKETKLIIIGKEVASDSKC